MISSIQLNSLSRGTGAKHKMYQRLKTASVQSIYASSQHQQQTNGPAGAVLMFVRRIKYKTDSASTE